MSYANSGQLERALAILELLYQYVDIGPLMQQLRDDLIV
jgi:hypothetical protein